MSLDITNLKIIEAYAKPPWIILVTVTSLEKTKAIELTTYQSSSLLAAFINSSICNIMIT